MTPGKHTSERMIYTVQDDSNHTRLAFEQRGKRGPSRITFFPSSDLTSAQRVELARQVSEAVRPRKTRQPVPQV